MPYFHNDVINLLFIHIPKTGGSSVETYFSQKYNITLNDTSLYNIYDRPSPQHHTYEYILTNKNSLHINFSNIIILSIVRNPYERIISDLFFNKLIDINTSKQEVYIIITQKYIPASVCILDNHQLPQYRFLVDNKNKINKKIILLKMETLTQDMQKLGYEDFNLNLQTNKYSELNYYDYLSKDSIHFINHYYKKDFLYFNYKMIQNLYSFTILNTFFDPDIYSPYKNKNGEYSDKTILCFILKKGILCPCEAIKDKIYNTNKSFSSHCKTEKHKQWLLQLNKKIKI